MREHGRGLDGRTVARGQTGKPTAVARSTMAMDCTAVGLPEPMSQNLARSCYSSWHYIYGAIDGS